MVDVLGWCLDLGVTCVSVFAFSIENFRRDPQEVAMLMDLAERKLDELLQVLSAFAEAQETSSVRSCRVRRRRQV
jgi:ditrans,polycis-polyprenyl diphosphate synthase